MIKRYWQRGLKQKIMVIGVGIVVLLSLFILRDDYQPLLLFLRKYIFIVLLSLTVLFFGIRQFRRSPSAGRRLGILGLLVTFFGLLYTVGWHLMLYDYMKTYNVFKSLNKVEVNTLPLTQNERIQPLRNVFSMANESVGETKDVSIPRLVRIDGPWQSNPQKNTSGSGSTPIQKRCFLYPAPHLSLGFLMKIESQSPFP